MATNSAPLNLLKHRPARAVSAADAKTKPAPSPIVPSLAAAAEAKEKPAPAPATMPSLAAMAEAKPKPAAAEASPAEAVMAEAKPRPAAVRPEPDAPPLLSTKPAPRAFVREMPVEFDPGDVEAGDGRPAAPVSPRLPRPRPDQAITPATILPVPNFPLGPAVDLPPQDRGAVLSDARLAEAGQDLEPTVAQKASAVVVPPPTKKIPLAEPDPVPAAPAPAMKIVTAKPTAKPAGEPALQEVSPAAAETPAPQDVAPAAKSDPAITPAPGPAAEEASMAPSAAGESKPAADATPVADDESPRALVQALQNLQDKIAAGSKAAFAEQRDLLGRIDEAFRRAPDSAWQDRLNASALVTYALSGGGPKVLRERLQHDPLPALDENLLRGALAYVEGDSAKARALLADANPQSFPPSMGSQVAIAQAALFVSDDPARAAASLDVARLLAPGTLAEEAALRREILIMTKLQDVDRLSSLVRQYLQRFPHSVFAGDFRRVLATALGGMRFLEDKTQLPRLEEMLAALDPDARGEVYLLVARKAVLQAKVDAARFAAGEALKTAATGSPEQAQALLYQAAASLVLSDGFKEARADLKRIDVSLLDGSDRQLYAFASSLGEFDRGGFAAGYATGTGRAGAGRRRGKTRPGRRPRRRSDQARRRSLAGSPLMNPIVDKMVARAVPEKVQGIGEKLFDGAKGFSRFLDAVRSEGEGNARAETGGEKPSASAVRAGPNAKSAAADKTESASVVFSPAESAPVASKRVAHRALAGNFPTMAGNSALVQGAPDGGGGGDLPVAATGGANAAASALAPPAGSPPAAPERATHPALAGNFASAAENSAPVQGAPDSASDLPVAGTGVGRAAASALASSAASPPAAPGRATRAALAGNFPTAAESGAKAQGAPDVASDLPVAGTGGGRVSASALASSEASPPVTPGRATRPGLAGSFPTAAESGAKAQGAPDIASDLPVAGTGGGNAGGKRARVFGGKPSGYAWAANAPGAHWGFRVGGKERPLGSPRVGPRG